MHIREDRTVFPNFVRAMTQAPVQHQLGGPRSRAMTLIL